MPVPVKVECPKQQQNIDDAPLPQTIPEDSDHHQEGSSSPVEGTTHLHREKQLSYVYSNNVFFHTCTKCMDSVTALLSYFSTHIRVLLVVCVPISVTPCLSFPYRKLFVGGLADSVTEGNSRLRHTVCCVCVVQCSGMQADSDTLFVCSTV